MKSPENASQIACLLCCWICSWLCLVLFAFSGCRTRTETPVKNESKDAVIFGGSMAPAFFGKNFGCSCTDCGFDIRFDVASAPPQDAVCPNCGDDVNAREQWIRVYADHVEVDTVDDPATFKRFNVVAFRHPERENEFGVKRIVGFPGEEVEVKGGDVLVNGKVVRKTFEDQQEMAITVFDSRAHSKTIQRWSPVGTSTAWTIKHPELVFFAPNRTDSTPLELKYLHIRGYRGLGSPRDLDAVEDFYAYNQTKVRALNRVRDIAVSFSFVSEANSEFVAGFDHLSKRVSVSLIVSDAPLKLTKNLSVEFSIAGEVQSTTTTLFDSSIECQVYISVFDGQMLVAVDGDTLFAEECEIPMRVQPQSSPFFIGGIHGEIAFQRVKIFRDIYYLGPGNSSMPWKVPGDGFVLLGDNVPVSLDSRNWSPSRLQPSELIGRATNPHH